MIRAALLACLLATPCLAQPTLSAANFELVGGYRIPSYSSNAYGAGTSTYTEGGMSCYTFSPTDFRCWHDQSSHKLVYQSSTSSAMGTGSTYTSWPLLSEASSADEVWTRAELFADRYGQAQYHQVEGICYDPEDELLYLSMRSTYNTEADSTQWLATVDVTDNSVTSTQPDLSGLNQSRYGGGMTLVPNAWATTHVSGQRLAFASGGYRSGQGSSHGPTFCTFHPSTFAYSQLMYHPVTANAITEKAKVARAYPDYGPTIEVSWVNAVEGSVGYWPGAAIKGNGSWVDFGGGLEGVMWFSRHPVGNLDYDLQNETFSNTNQNVVYFIPKAKLEESASGSRAADSFAEQFTYFRWDETNNGLGINRRPKSCYYDRGSGYLWVYYEFAWTSGVEYHPIIAAYRLVQAVRPQRLTVSGSLTLEVAE